MHTAIKTLLTGLTLTSVSPNFSLASESSKSAEPSQNCGQASYLSSVMLTNGNIFFGVSVPGLDEMLVTTSDSDFFDDSIRPLTSLRDASIIEPAEYDYLLDQANVMMQDINENLNQLDSIFDQGLGLNIDDQDVFVDASASNGIKVKGLLSQQETWNVMMDGENGNNAVEHIAELSTVIKSSISSGKDRQICYRSVDSMMQATIAPSQ